MKVHEYQAKDLLRAAGVAVPDGIVITSAEEAGAAFDQLNGGLIVVKAQVHAGGRGKGVAIGPDEDRAEALEIASGAAPRPDGMAKGCNSSAHATKRSRPPPACSARRSSRIRRVRKGRRSPRCWSPSATTSPASFTSAWRSTARCSAPC